MSEYSVFTPLQRAAMALQDVGKHKLAAEMDAYVNSIVDWKEVPLWNGYMPGEGPDVDWGIRNHPIDRNAYSPYCKRCGGRSDDAIHHPPSERMLEAERAAQPCLCICHDMGGGPAHPNEKCKCNGGEGMDA